MVQRNVGHGDDRDVTGINCTIDRAIVSSDRRDKDNLAIACTDYNSYRRNDLAWSAASDLEID